MKIQTLFKIIGLTEKERAIYLALFKNGKATPAILAKQTKINRATVYTIARGLQSRGIVAEDVSGKKRYFSALSPESFRQMVETPMRELEEKKASIEEAIEELSRIRAEKTYAVPKIRFVEEAEVEDFLYANIGKWSESAHKIDDGILYGFQDEAFLKTYSQFIRWYWRQPKSKNFKMYQIGNNSLTEKEFFGRIKHVGRGVRFSPDLVFSSSVWVGGEYLVMVVTKQHPHYLVEIHDETLSRNMREVFKKLWNELGKNTQKNYEKYSA